MVLTGAEYLLRQGRKEGREEGRVETLLEQLECRFGSLPARVVTVIRALPNARLQELTRQIMIAQSLDDLHLE